MKKIAFLLGIIFFVFGFFVLPHYGMNWDEPLHFSRGQAILHYFLTGEKDYKKLSPLIKYSQKEDSIFFVPLDAKKDEIQRSMYQDNQENFTFFLKDYGHPPLSDIFSSLFNVVLFQKLKLINDVDSYHVYSLFLAAVLVGVLFWWTAKYYGMFAGIIASLSLSVYPLFLGESHFNIKDPPEAVFYSLTLIFFYEGFIRKKTWQIIISSVFLGFAFSTKFNALFIPFTVIPFIFIFFLSRKRDIKKYIKFSLSLIFYPVITFLIFFSTWPFLWRDPIKGFLSVVQYYKDIGTNSSFDPRYITIFGINTYAIKWILFSTPIVILFFFATGVSYLVLKSFKEKDKTTIFVFLWLAIPILRVTRPDAGIYGGVRQVMEYIPSMSILAGVGATFLLTLISKKLTFTRSKYKNLIISVILISFFIPIVVKLIKIHPNEGVYFNSLIGGLKGAKEKEIPAWGESLGNPYRQGIKWIDENAPKNSEVAINYGGGSNIPWNLLRGDIKYSNQYRSAVLRKGEYIIGLTHNSGLEDTFYLEYLNLFLRPVYQASVDGVPLLKIWKNDLAHTNSRYKMMTEIQEKPNVIYDGKSTMIDLKKTYSLAEMKLVFKGKCEEDTEGSLQVSNDKMSWVTLDNNLRGQFLIPFTTYQNGNEYLYYFSDKNVRYIMINFYSKNSCFDAIESATFYKYGN